MGREYCCEKRDCILPCLIGTLLDVLQRGYVGVVYA